MGRRPLNDPPGDAQLGELLDDPRAHRIAGATRSRTLSDLAVVVERVDVMIRSREGWDDAGPRELVGLYAWCHRSVYNVLPVELEVVAEFRAASRAALSLLHQHFHDDPVAAVQFIKWSWKREQGRADWAKREKKDRNRMGWRLQFSPRQITDYRVAVSGRG